MTLGGRRQTRENVGASTIQDTGAVLVVFVDGGSWWLINRSSDTLSDVEAFVCEGAIACELAGFRADHVVPSGQLRCDPMDLPSAEGYLTVEVAWTLDNDRHSAKFAIRAPGTADVLEV